MFTRYKIKRLHKKIAGMHKARENSPVDEIELEKERTAIRQLAALYRSARYKKHSPFAFEDELECYRLASQLEDLESRFQLAMGLISRGRHFAEQGNGIFASDVMNQYAKLSFDEGLRYLVAAENGGHVMAKRQHGLCYINGWGLPIDLDAGFRLVIASIEQAGAWAQATEIFKELGLNKPEFFSYIMSNKQK